ncbi:VanZ like family protein [Nocardioides dokdonensis FR1436]|uniref:VanZ like family protein n=1 Tax=Nocardioides dokdonensis FR1436 TaxID=1300347 RepID=A0A1A9GJH3_9ACTN|nr:VanZ like family protein [Nocardioides dokdonensis FR1436]
MPLDAATEPSNRTRRRLAVALGAYCLFIAAIVLLPTGAVPSAVVTHVAGLADAMGTPARLTAGARIEFGLNALMVVPISALGGLLWPRWNWRDWTAAAFVASASVELIQGLFLPDRSATFVDVCANTLGGLMGALLVAVTLRAARHGSPHETT